MLKKTEDYNNFDNMNFHIDEENNRTKAIRRAGFWATVGRTLILLGIAAILFAIAIFILARIIVPQTQLFHTQNAIAERVKQEVNKGIADVVAKNTAEAIKQSVDDASQQAAQQAAEKTGEKIKEEAVKSATKAANEAAEKATEKAMKDTLPKAIEETAKKAVEDSKKQLEQITQAEIKKNKENFQKLAKEEAEKAVKANEEKLNKIKERIKVLKTKDVVTNFTVYYKKDFKKNGFNQVVNAWDFKTSEDKEPYAKRCFTQKNKITIDLASIRNNKKRINFPANKQFYNSLNIDEDFENEARELCNF